MNLNAKRVFYVMTGLLVLVAGGIIYGMYWANTQLNTKETEIQTLRVESRNLDQQILNARKLSSQLEEQADTQQVADEVLPEFKTQENIIGEMISIAGQRDIILQNFNFTGGSSAPNVQISQADPVDGIPGVLGIGFSTAFETSYDNTIGFLQDIENNKRRFEVTSLDITPVLDDNGNVASYAAQITLVTYVRP